ncbi:transcription termination factor 2-like [Dermacentor silvarum]|uniref:transcription termination factor 2-like n=1 Tax=Dermacentor silvarum TaxID=543639 RepID=UPI002100E0F5|nr:transcription termination factor 2-like [Dermacentor silvarum]
MPPSVKTTIALSDVSSHNEAALSALRNFSIKAPAASLSVATYSQSAAIVVVSRWTSLLSLVRRHLERQGIPSVTIQGSVPGQQRASHVANFNQQQGGPTVMLLSLEAGGVGLNLIGGNHMFVLDVHW